MKLNTSTLTAAACALVMFAASSAHAQITLSISESGSDVVFSYSGDWDVFTNNGTASSTPRILGTENAFGPLFYSLDGDAWNGGAGLTKSSGLWTTVDTFNAGTVSGDYFGFQPTLIYGPSGYTAGDSISGSLTASGKTLASLGFTAGDSGSFTGGGNTVNYSVSAVPEPSSFALLAGCFGLTWVMLRRRSRAACC